MLNALREIVDFIGILIDFVIEFVGGIIQLLKLIPTMVTMLTSSLDLLPVVLVGFAGVTITVSVIFIIVGREGGGESG